MNTNELEMTTNELLHKLRNPYGQEPDYQRVIKLAAADKIEELEKRLSVSRHPIPCSNCGHNNMGTEGLCVESVPLMDKEPHGAKLCGCPCVNYGVRGAWWQTDRPAASPRL